MRAFSSCALALVLVWGTVSHGSNEFEFDENPTLSFDLSGDQGYGFFGSLSSIVFYGGLGILASAGISYWYLSYKVKSS